MESHQLSFGKINILRDDLAEVIINGAVEVDTAMVEEFHHFLLSYFANSFSLLINKTNPYSTKFDALMQSGTLTEINKMAVFAPNKVAKLSADFSAAVLRTVDLDIEVFSNRADALAWL